MENDELVAVYKDIKICVACDSDTTYIRPNGYPVWRFHDGNWYCQKCYDFYIWKPVYNENRLRFGKKHIHMDYSLRKNRCEKCGNKIGDKYIDHFGKEAVTKVTNRHHYFYLVIMPWACTIELCFSCHRKVSKK